MPCSVRLPDVAPPTLSENGLAASFVARHGAEWRYVAGLGKLAQVVGQGIGSDDDTHAVLEAIRQIARSALTADTKPSA